MAPQRPSGRPITLFVPGPWSDAARCKGALGKTGGWSVEWIPNDGAFADAFRFGLYPREDLPKLATCPGAVIVEGTLDLPREADRLEQVGTALAEAGGLGIRIEESKAAWAFEPWLDLLRRRDPVALYRALVVTLVDRSGASVCGMHLFARPDAALAWPDPDEASRLLTSLCVYQLAEDPLLLAGHTFQPDHETERRSLERWPDDRYPASHCCHNPFGTWRLVPLHEKKRSIPELAQVPIPALVTLLLAAERQAGRPLARPEVEAIRDRAVCMSMSHADARALEVSRGYADLDPELAFEHWQIARNALAALE